MAKGEGATFGQRQADLQHIVQQAATAKRKSIYLFAGDSFQTAAAAKLLLDALVPEDRRDFNFETYDGRTTPIAGVLDSMRMRGFFGGVKLIWLRETTLFLSGEKRGDVADSMFSAAREGREIEAAEKLLTLAALAGWSQEQFGSTQWSALSKSRLKEVFGDDLDAEQLAQVAAIHSVCQTRQLRVGGYQDEAAGLLQSIEEGLPPEVVLVLTASTVDARKRLFKRIAEVGAVLDLSAERDRSGALSRDTIEALVGQMLDTPRKRLQSEARDLIIRRAGADIGLLSAELEKLSLATIGQTAISAEDVRRNMLDLAESWIFDFTAALGTRQIAPALMLLRGLLDQGEPALRLLAMIAREVRLLLIARECLDSTLRGAFRPDLSYPNFQTRVLPHIDEETQAAFGKAHPFVLYKRFQDASRMSTPALRQAVLRLADIDVRLKSTRTDAALLLESFVIEWCRTQPARQR